MAGSSAALAEELKALKKKGLEHQQKAEKSSKLLEEPEIS